MNKTILTLLLGIGIGLLLAPDKGSVTLKKLKDKLDDLTDKAQDEADDLVEKGKHAYNSGKSKLKDTIG